MIKTIIGVLLLLWILGLLIHIGGAVIHVLLIVALVVFIYDRVVGRNKV